MRTPAVDLHMHSVYSDGFLSVAELMERCKEKGLKIAAITDHDSVEGVKEAKEIDLRHRPRILSGVELSVTHLTSDGDLLSFHLLGYGIKCRPALVKKLAELRQIRLERLSAMADKLRALKFVVEDSWTDKVGTVSRTDLALAVMLNPQNAARLTREKIGMYGRFIDKYLDPGKPAYVEKKRLTMMEGIDFIHQSGGLAVWAHPLHSRRSEVYSEQAAQLVPVFQHMGLDGVEVFHTLHGKRETAMIYYVCRRYGLLMTAGSDFHGGMYRDRYPGLRRWHDFGLPWRLDKKFIDLLF